MLLWLAGCSSVLGISDPTTADTGDRDAGTVDSVIDGPVDANPSCTAPLKLAAERLSPVPKPGTGFALGKLDDGGVYDIAVATGSDVVILHGNGAGSFGGNGAPSVVPTPATDVVSADFDSDGDDDLAMWTVGGTSVVVRRTNRALAPPVEAPQPLTGPFTNVRRVLVEQLDSETRPDLLVYDRSGGTRAHTSNALAPGSFTRGPQINGGEFELLAMVALDNVEQEDALFRQAGSMAVSHLSNAFMFRGPFQLAMGATGTGIAVGHFNADDRPDFVLTTPEGLVLYVQHDVVAAVFRREGVISPMQSAPPILVGDVNGDGLDDIITPTAAILQCAGPVGGVGVFTHVEPIAAAQPAQLVDVTGDGKLDLVRLDGATVKVRVQQ
ncbi:MAG TPA: VCBS repeat-containing protein [Kofleriaceae bacterium]|nr:VCBS repeat-containing protein [Kofleriaceae bacterium]